MNNFFQLIRNEQMKTYSQISTWVMVIILAVIVIGMGVLFKVGGEMSEGSQVDGNWEEQLQTENERMKKESQEDEFMAGFNAEQMAINEYRLENDIPPTEYNVWDFVLENQTNVSIISLFTIIIAASIIANEFRWGTIKLLLIRPISRTKILGAKYVSVLLFAISMLFFLYAMAFITGGLLFGFSGVSEPHLFIMSGEVQETPQFQHTVYGYLLSSVNLVMMATFAFMVSAVFRNSALAIGIAIFLMMSGNAIVAFFASKEWAKYILFANTNLTQFFSGTPMIDGLTLEFSITMLVVYFVIFLGLSWIFFTKRDVSNA
ncbi:ABC transporter permease subunit [Halobacillus sp. Marseille-Q1614]|uniref:ABC transporter permease subunit n=1 Tax=Halobacillus sp. Marseille-Q1614 TaxID=2709134 RepID=UPI00156E295F|nr:ABC transporter permease subunit [Halobacillus sp. Marseille-Q1614]